MQPIIANLVLLEGLLGLGTVSGGLKSTISKATIFHNSSKSVCQKPEAGMICAYKTLRMCV